MLEAPELVLEQTNEGGQNGEEAVRIRDLDKYLNDEWSAEGNVNDPDAELQGGYTMFAA